MQAEPSHDQSCACPACSADRARVRALFVDLDAQGPKWRSLQLRGLVERTKRAEHVHELPSSGNAAGPVEKRPIGAPSLESLGITGHSGLDAGPVDPQLGQPAVFLAPSERWAAVERATETHRRARALAHEERAQQAAEGHFPTFTLLPGGNLYQNTRERRARWHRQRAGGQLARFVKIRDCGTRELLITCKGRPGVFDGCGHERTIKAHCSVGRLCPACRAQAAKKRQARYSLARGRAVTDLMRAQRFRGRDRWTEKHLTITAPHVEADRFQLESVGPRAAVRERIRVICDAWLYFSRYLQGWIRRKPEARRGIAYYRAFEWTASDGDGHPHFHVWIVSPFLPRAMLDAWWRRAIVRALLPDVDVPRGRAFDVPWVQAQLAAAGIEGWDGASLSWRIRAIDQRPGDIVREVLKGRGNALKFTSAGEELIRYFEGWQLVDAGADDDAIARAFEELDGRRLVQTSRGLLDEPEHACPECGAIGSTTVSLVPHDLEHDQGDKHEHDQARGPP